MFPKMLANHGEDFTTYLLDNIQRQLAKKIS
jgi:hypothetical protein